MELEVVGRHALLFDDDSNAKFVNSKEALVEWNSLFIDRYDVRHLLTSPPASFKRLRQSSGSVTLPDSHLESEFDVERYADLPAPTSSYQEPTEVEADAGTINGGGFHAVAFSYGNTADSSEQKDDDRNSEDVFSPPFPIPENLVYSLPSSEKVHQIIGRTALFVSQHGGQSEIVLRVKQGDNPTFGFLMPHHHLHPYFRYLVDHPEILNASSDDKSQKKTNADSQSCSSATGGALSLLGSVYGSVEDDDLVPEEAKKSRLSNATDSVETTTTGDLTDQHRLKKQDALDDVSQKDERSSKLLPSSKEKASALSKSGFGSTVKSKSANNGNKEGVLGSSSSADVNKKISANSLISNGESLVIEPPSKLKRLVDRIVVIILKNGQGFEALLIEQDKNHGRFPFLLSSNQYHLYYKKMLRMALEARAVAKSFGSEKDAEKETGQSKLCEESAIQDLPFDYDRKEKFKMIIGKTKREIQELPSKELQQPPVAISADAVAAILQAATRGIKPNLDIFNLSTRGDVGGRASSHESQHSSQPQSSLEKRTGIIHKSGTVSVAKEIAKTAAMAAAGEADSLEAGLTKEQKLKAERLKRAKMFAAMIKSGVPQPVGKDPPRGLSAEPPRYSSGVEVGLPQPVGKDPPRGLSAEPRVGTQGAKYREGSSASVDAVTFHKLEKTEKHYDNELDESAATKKRHYRSQRHEEEDEEGESDEEDHRHSRKKHRSHHSSRHHRERSKDRHKHRRRHSISKDRESRHSRHKHDSEDDDKHHHRHKHDNSSEDEYESRKHKRRSSHKDDDRREKHKKRSNTEEGDLEEGEIRAKSSDQSPSIVLDAIKEKSVDRLMNVQQDRASSEQPQTTVVPDDLRAKIRAMLLATL